MPKLLSLQIYVLPSIVLLHPAENCSTAVPGDANGYFVTTLTTLSSSEQETSEADTRSRTVQRKSELFDNPIYGHPNLMASIDSVRSPASDERDEVYSRLDSSLHSITSRQSSRNILTSSQTSSYHGRSCTSFGPLPCQLRENAAQKYEDECRRQIISRRTTEDAVICDQVDEEMSNLTIEGEGMVTVVNASYEALPCHTENIGGRGLHSVHAINHLLDYDHLPQRTVVFSEVVNKKRTGYRPSFSVVEEQCEEVQPKPPSCLRKKKYYY